MKNLENKEILSDEILEAIDKITTAIPYAVFGGSIALNAVGLINRKISDIDLFFHLGESLTQNNFLSIHEGQITSDTVTDINGELIQRTGAKINDVKCCCFKVPQEGLEHSKHLFTRNGKTYSIRIQSVNYAIEAKKVYCKNSNNPKHKQDLESVKNFFDNLL